MELDFFRVFGFGFQVWIFLNPTQPDRKPEKNQVSLYDYKRYTLVT